MARVPTQSHAQDGVPRFAARKLHACGDALRWVLSSPARKPCCQSLRVGSPSPTGPSGPKAAPMRCRSAQKLFLLTCLVLPCAVRGSQARALFARARARSWLGRAPGRTVGGLPRKVACTALVQNPLGGNGGPARLLLCCRSVAGAGSGAPTRGAGSTPPSTGPSMRRALQARG